MSEQTVYGGCSAPSKHRRTKVRTHHLQKWKNEGHKWAMLTAYDFSTARAFDEAGIPVLLVGDSAANVVYGYDTTVPISVDELIPLVRGVVRGAQHALVVADLPFGSYEAGPVQALATATRFLKETGAHAVKLEGGERVAEQIATLTAAGIPVMAHIGFTPQSVNSLGGFRVQGRGDAAEQTIHDAIAVAEAGAFAVVMEMVPAELATQITGKLTIPTVGIGAGPNCDAQVLVWQDMAGTHQRQDRQVRQALRRCGRRITPRRNAIRRRGGQRSVPGRGAQLLAELRGAFGQERVDAFAAVGTVGARRDQPALEFHLLLEAVAERGQHQLLHRAGRTPCRRGHLVGHRLRPGVELSGRDHLGDQTPVRGLGRGQRAVGQHQLLGARMPTSRGR